MNNYSESSEPKAAKVTQVHNAMSDLAEQHEELAKTIIVLEGHLKSVLVSPGVEVGKLGIISGPHEQPLCPLASSITEETEKVRNAITMLRNITDRLEL